MVRERRRRRILNYIGNITADIAALVALGVFGETTKAPQWTPWHHAFGIVVFVGVAGEMIADAGEFVCADESGKCN
jgi:hypothetical protein